MPRINIPKLIASAKSAERSGNLVKARQLYGDVLSRFPANKRAQEGLAKLDRNDPRVAQLLALWNAGKVRSALDLSDQLSIAHPTVRDIRAAALRALGQPGAACAIYDASLKRDPRNAKLWYNAGGARLEDFRFEEAAEHLTRAVELDASPPHLLALAQCRSEQGYHAEVIALAESVYEMRDAPARIRARAITLVGKARLQIGQPDAAESAFAKALNIAPDDPDTLHSQGMAAAARGDTETAMDRYRAALLKDETRTNIHRSLARLTKYTSDHPHLGQMQKLVSRNLPPSRLAELHFALFKASEDIGQMQTAFDHLQAGNHLRRNLLRYDPEREAALFAHLLESEPAPLLKSCVSGPRPIFVVGLPRSGTTLTEQVLSGAPKTVAGGELPLAGQTAKRYLTDRHNDVPNHKALAAFARDMAHGMQQCADPDHVLIDKMPLNFRWAGMLLSAMPEARIVWLERDPLANACSLYRNCFAGAGNRFAYDADDIAKMLGHERRFRTHMVSRWPDRIRVLNLHVMTTTPEPVIRDLVTFCDLEWSDACLKPHARKGTVLTASAQQVRKPLMPSLPGAHDVNPLCRAHLQDALERHGITG